MGNEVSLDFREYYSPDGEIDHQHYAFLVPEDDFDQILGRLTARGQQYWALRHCPRQLRLLQRAGAAPTRAVERARAPGAGRAVNLGDRQDRKGGDCGLDAAHRHPPGQPVNLLHETSIFGTDT